MSAMVPNHCIPFDDECSTCNPPLSRNPDDEPAAPLPVEPPPNAICGRCRHPKSEHNAPKDGPAYCCTVGWYVDGGRGCSCDRFALKGDGQPSPVSDQTEETLEGLRMEIERLTKEAEANTHAGLVKRLSEFVTAVEPSTPAPRAVRLAVEEIVSLRAQLAAWERHRAAVLTMTRLSPAMRGYVGEGEWLAMEPDFDGEYLSRFAVLSSMPSPPSPEPATTEKP